MKKSLNVVIVLAILATPHLVLRAHQTRGYWAIGGELLLIPLILLGYTVVGQVILLYKGCFTKEKAPTDASQ